MSFLSGLFGGGGTPQNSFQPNGISSNTGFSVGSGGSISESPTLQSNIGSLQSTFGAGANAFGQLASTVAPGFNQLTKAGLSQINTQAKANLSTLNQNLSTRRIQGSSFANAQISQANADTEQQKANYVAQSFLQSLQASSSLTQQQYSLATQQYSTAISQSNIEAGVAASLTSSNNQIMGQISQANTALQAQAIAGAGQFAGTLLGLGTGTANSTLGGGLISGATSAGSSVFGSLGRLFGGSTAAATGSEVTDALASTLSLAG